VALRTLVTVTGLPAPLLLGGTAVLGACVGSFLNVVVHRVPRGESIVRPRSRCPACGTPVAPRDNIPLLSYLLLRGRCRRCGHPIGWRYPALELAGGAVPVVALLAAPTLPHAVAASLLTWWLLALLLIDLQHQLLPDALTLPGIVAGLLLCPWLAVPRAAAAAGAAGGFLALLALQRGYAAWRGRDGLGGGDVKLAAMLGAWLGWQGVLLTFLLGSLAGSVVGLALVLSGRGDRTTRLPYGVFLAPAAVAVLAWGGRFWNWYLG